MPAPKPQWPTHKWLAGATESAGLAWIPCIQRGPSVHAHSSLTGSRLAPRPRARIRGQAKFTGLDVGLPLLCGTFKQTCVPLLSFVVELVLPRRLPEVMCLGSPARSLPWASRHVQSRVSSRVYVADATPSDLESHQSLQRHNKLEWIGCFLNWDSI